MTTLDATPGRRPGLIRHGEFRKLWAAETISQFGTQVTNLALPLIAALALNATPLEFSLVGTFEFLPFILLSLPAGVWIDRRRRRPIMIAGDLGRGLMLLSIPVAYELHAMTIWQLYIVGFVNGCLTVFFDVSYQSYLPSLVDRDDILEGNSKLEISRSGAQIAGPGLAGELIGVLTAPVAIILDSISFFVSAFLVLAIRKPEPAPVIEPVAAGEKAPGMKTEVAAGLRYVLGHRYLRNIAACTGISNLFSQIGLPIVVLYLVRPVSEGGHGISAQQLGVAFSIASIGFLLGALTGNKFGKRFGVGPTIIGSAMVFGPSVVLVALAPDDLVLYFATAAIFIGGFAGVVYNINQVSFRQAITPARMQGRMNATMRFIVWGTIPVGSVIGGVLGGAIGLHATIWIGAIGGIFSFIPLLFSPLRSLMAMPEPLDDGPGGDAIDVGAEALDETPHAIPTSPHEG